MYEWIPQKTNQKARNAVFLLFGGAAVLLAFPIAFPSLPFRWVVQLLAFGLLTAAIFMVARYTTKSYLYRVVPCEDGTLDLTVTEMKAGGKGQITVCRVGLSHVRKRVLADVTHPSEADAFEARLRKERKKFFDYCVDFHPAQSILILVEEGGERLVLRLSYDPTLFDLLAPTAAPDGQEEDE